MAKKGKKKGHSKHNPFGFKSQDGKDLTIGVLLGLGGVVTKAAIQNLPFDVPASLVQGPGAALLTGGVGYGLSMLAKKVKFAAPYADDIKKGAIAIAAYQLAAPTLLPMLAFTDKAKLHAQMAAQAQKLLEIAQAAASGQPQGGAPPSPGANGTGDAFVLSRGGITTADRAPRDTAALAGVGDAYAQERPGFAGAPNNLRAPWSRSIYNRR